MSKTSITKQEAIEAYDSSNEDQKKFLEKVFGEEIFTKSIRDRVKTFEDALAIVGKNPNRDILLQYNGADKEIIAAVAFLKLSIICRALNEDWVPDWSNSDERKYYAWLEYGEREASPSGFGFSRSRYDDSNTYSIVGSRLCYKSSELAIYAGQQFEALYNDLFTL